MSTALAQLNNSMTMWEDNKQIEEIRKVFAPTLTENEFKIFVGLGKATGLNPFLKEIWAVKYGKDSEGKELAAQIFIGRDGYRKGAHSSPKYDYHQVDAVYENDEFKVDKGEVSHSYNLKDRGNLKGAYCIVQLKTSSKPHYVFVELEEYSTNQSLWAEPCYKTNKYGKQYKAGGKPATMIKKVAEAQGLRMALDIFEGTYSEYEAFNNQNENTNERVIQGETRTEQLKNILNTNGIDKEPVIVDSDGVIIEQESSKGNENIPASIVQIHQIETLMNEKAFDENRKKKALEHYNVNTLDELTDAKAISFLELLRRA